MTLTGMKKHVAVLERAGLVVTEKIGRVRTCTLGARRLEQEAAWLERYRQQWDERFDELDCIVAERVAAEVKRTSTANTKTKTKTKTKKKVRHRR
jgi:DNA-binding transcriptional ArsR family regulator